MENDYSLRIEGMEEQWRALGLFQYFVYEEVDHWGVWPKIKFKRGLFEQYFSFWLECYVIH